MIINQHLLDKISSQAQHNERLRMNYNFHASGEALSQRLLNALEPGTLVPCHRHRHTSETYILLRGKLKVSFYDHLGQKTAIYYLDPLKGAHGVEIPLGTWHSLEVLESGSVIFEAKDGPYAPITSEDLLSL